MSSLNVLIVDDAPLLRQRLRERLERMHGMIIVGEAADVERGLEAFRALKPDAVIVDLQMPGCCGIDVLADIKRERPETVVIVLTNYPLPQVSKRSRQAGADFFFDICTDIESVVGVIREMMQRRARR